MVPLAFSVCVRKTGRTGIEHLRRDVGEQAREGEKEGVPREPRQSTAVSPVRPSMPLLFRGTRDAELGAGSSVPEPHLKLGVEWAGCSCARTSDGGGTSPSGYAGNLSLCGKQIRRQIAGGRRSRSCPKPAILNGFTPSIKWESSGCTAQHVTSRDVVTLGLVEWSAGLQHADSAFRDRL